MSYQRLVVLLNSGYQQLNCIRNKRLKQIVEQASVSEPGQGGGRQGRSENINMQKMRFDESRMKPTDQKNRMFIKPTDKEIESIESTST